jgi:hypothetical protein
MPIILRPTSPCLFPSGFIREDSHASWHPDIGMRICQSRFAPPISLTSNSMVYASIPD